MSELILKNVCKELSKRWEVRERMLAPRLINANDLMINTTLVNLGTEDYPCIEEILYKEDIDEAPTIDAVPVVRCKDCVHRGRVAYCPMMHMGIHGAVPPYDKDVDLTEDNGFCYKGKKREGENDNG